MEEKERNQGIKKIRKKESNERESKHNCDFPSGLDGGDDPRVVCFACCRRIILYHAEQALLQVGTLATADVLYFLAHFSLYFPFYFSLFLNWSFFQKEKLFQ